MAALGIAERSSRKEIVGQMIKAMCKKFSTSTKVWLRLLESQLTSGEGDKARATLDRALQSLPKRKHIKIITRSASYAYSPTVLLSVVLHLSTSYLSQ